MSVLDPKQDAAALQPVIDEAEQKVIQGLADTVAPALSDAVKNALDGLVITITISKKE